MKRLYFLFALAILLYSCDNSSEPTNTESNQFTLKVENIPKNFYEIDLKTKFVDKMAEVGTKYGSKIYINDAEWAKIVEYSEDYSLWVKNLRRDTSDVSLTRVTFDLELQEPSMAMEGKVFKKRHFIITYARDALDNIAGNSDAAWVAKRFKQYAERCKKTGELCTYINNTIAVGSANPYTAMCSKMLNKFIAECTGEVTQKYQQVEAVICGAECYGQLEEWLWQHEQGQF